MLAKVLTSVLAAGLVIPTSGSAQVFEITRQLGTPSHHYQNVPPFFTSASDVVPFPELPNVTFAISSYDVVRLRLVAPAGMKYVANQAVFLSWPGDLNLVPVGSSNSGVLHVCPASWSITTVAGTAPASTIEGFKTDGDWLKIRSTGTNPCSPTFEFTEIVLQWDVTAFSGASHEYRMFDGGGFSSGPELVFYQNLASGAPDPGQAIFLEPLASCNDIVQSASWGTCGTTAGTRGNPPIPGAVMASDDAGGAYVAWSESPVPPVRLQRVMPDGALAPGWPIEGVTVAADSGGGNLALVRDGSGGVFTVWDGRRNGQVSGYCMRTTSSGAPEPGWPVGGAVVPSGYQGTKDQDRAAADGAGGVYVAGETHTQRLTPSGAVAAGWPPNGIVASGLIEAIEADGSGGVFVLTQSNVTRHSSTGAIIWQANLPVSTYPYPLADGAGGVFIALEAPFSVIHMTSAGSLDPTWPPGGVVLEASPRIPDIQSDGTGGVLVAWTKGGTPTRIAAQRITPAGTIATGWPASGFTIGPAGQIQSVPSVTHDGTGGGFLTWMGRMSTGPAGFWAARICPTGTLAPEWPLDGTEVCPNVRYTVSGGGGFTPMVYDGAGGAYASWYRRTVTTGWGGSVQVQRLGSEPPSMMISPIVAGSPSSAVVGNVTVTFDAVSTGGNLYFDLTTGAVPPAGFQTVPATAPAVYELTTSAVYTGDVEVCIDYDPADVEGSEGGLRLLHYEGASGTPVWVDITTSLDVNANRICGVTTTLSPFAIVEQVVTDGLAPSASFQLHQNRPNPFNPSTTITYEIPTRSRVQLKIFDVRGRLVRTLVDRLESPGTHQAMWMGDDDHGRAIGSGVYFYSLEMPTGSLRRRMVLLK